VASLTPRNANEAVVGFGWSRAVDFMLVRLAKNLASVSVDMFSHLIYFVNNCYKFRAFNAVCKDFHKLYYCSTQNCLFLSI
jgi:hypothetical protein